MENAYYIYGEYKMTKPTKCRSEHAIQCELMRRIGDIAKIYPTFKIIENIFAIPNGGLRNKITARAMKYEGVKAGVLDLFLAIPMEPYHGIFIEIKSDKGILSPYQKKWSEFFLAQNYDVKICRTSYEALYEMFCYLWGIDGKIEIHRIFNEMGWRKD